jgi:hypothetical protein
MDSDLIVTCPICLSHLDSSDVPGHWGTHVQPVAVDALEHADEYTWVCECGSTVMTWADEGGASSGLALHMQMRHNISL